MHSLAAANHIESWTRGWVTLGDVTSGRQSINTDCCGPVEGNTELGGFDTSDGGVSLFCMTAWLESILVSK